MNELLLIKILFLTSISFVVALSLTPLITSLLYRYKLGKNIRNDAEAPNYYALHKGKEGTPTMGGVIVWMTIIILGGVFYLINFYVPDNQFSWLNFLTRKETLLPIGALVGAAFVGLVDDLLDIYQMGHKKRGIRFRFKVFLYAFVAFIGAYWFYFKLGFDTTIIPFIGPITLGFWFIPFFVIVTILSSFSANETDGLDGLAGGVLMTSFLSFGVIAFLQSKDNLVGLVAVTCGALLAFLWFNVFPARFFMGDTGSMGLGVLLSTIAFLTRSEWLILVICLIMVIEALSITIQLVSRKLFKKKVFYSAPIHHHFEVVGWPEAKITMRFWIISAIGAIFGIIIYLLGVQPYV